MQVSASILIVEPPARLTVAGAAQKGKQSLEQVPCSALGWYHPRFPDGTGRARAACAQTIRSLFVHIARVQACITGCQETCCKNEPEHAQDGNDPRPRCHRRSGRARGWGGGSCSSHVLWQCVTPCLRHRAAEGRTMLGKLFGQTGQVQRSALVHESRVSGASAFRRAAFIAGRNLR